MVITVYDDGVFGVGVHKCDWKVFFPNLNIFSKLLILQFINKTKMVENTILGTTQFLSVQWKASCSILNGYCEHENTMSALAASEMRSASRVRHRATTESKRDLMRKKGLLASREFSGVAETQRAAPNTNPFASLSRTTRTRTSCSALVTAVTGYCTRNA